MKRKNAFRTFLIHNNKSESYINYCENIEKAFGGMDMDDIIRSHKNISKARAMLEAMFPNEHSVNDYMSGLNRYLEFAVSNSTSATTGTYTISRSPLYHVARAKGVALTPDVAFAAHILEQEYAHIVQFAQKLLGHGVFDYIPVIISDETPEQDAPEAVQKVQGRFFATPNPYIEIYYRNMKPKDAATLRNCLAHEYLHYLHCVYAGTEYSKASKELKEALADFFGVLYSVYRHSKDDLARAKKRYGLWKKFEYGWSYAFALYFYMAGGKEMPFSPNYSDYEKHGSIGKFIQIFFSTKHPDSAFDALMKA